MNADLMEDNPCEQSAAVAADTSIKREVGRKVTILARLLRHRFDQSVAAIGATRSQWVVLAVVATRQGQTQRSIAEILEISEAAAGRLIDKLCTDGLLERRPRDDDRRAYSIHLTSAARPQLDRMATIARENEEVTFAGFEDAELEQLDKLLSRLYANVCGQK